MNDSAAKTFNTRMIAIIVLLFLLLIAAVIYLHSRHSTPIAAQPETTSTTTAAAATTTTQTSGTSSVTAQTEGSGTLTTTNQQTYVTYALKDPNRLPITQYPKAYGVELDFVASGGSLPSTLCLKVAADVPIKALFIPGHTDASSTIPTEKRGGAFEGITCFSGNISSEEDTSVYFNEKPSSINAVLSTSDVL